MTSVSTKTRRVGSMSKDPSVKPDFLKALTFEPLSRKNWERFVELFGERGACANCWCMYYRLSKADFDKGKAGNVNKNRMKKVVWSGKPTGLLAMYQGEAVAWLALAPREDFVKLKKSRVHKPIDDKPVWSIPCFFVDRKFRRKGLSVALLEGAVAYAKRKKIKILEAYPVIPTQKKWPDSFLWVGLLKSFDRAGFKVVDRTSRSRPMVRFNVGTEPAIETQGAG
jgi:GNAT superfamily N-acetyltransferase